MAHAVVVVVEDLDDLALALEVLRVDVDLRRLVEIGIAKLLEVVVVGVLLDIHHRDHELGELVFVHVELEGVHELVLIERERVLQVAHARHSGLHLIGNLRHGFLHCGRDLRFERLRDLFHALRHDFADVVLHRLAKLVLQSGAHLLRVVADDAVAHGFAHLVGGRPELFGDSLGNLLLQRVGIDRLAKCREEFLAFFGVEILVYIGVEVARHELPLQPCAKPGDEGLLGGGVIVFVLDAHLAQNFHGVELGEQADDVFGRDLGHRAAQVGHIEIHLGHVHLGEVHFRHVHFRHIETRCIELHVGEVEAFQVERTRIEREGCLDRFLVDFEQRAQIEIALFIVLLIERLAVEHVDFGLFQLLLHDFGIGSLFDEVPR